MGISNNQTKTMETKPGIVSLCEVGLNKTLKYI